MNYQMENILSCIAQSNACELVKQKARIELNEIDTLFLESTRQIVTLKNFLIPETKDNKNENAEDELPVWTKEYHIKFISYKTFTKVKRINIGFSPLELLGLLERTQIEILQQISGEIKPTITERVFVKENTEGETK